MTREQDRGPCGEEVRREPRRAAAAGVGVRDDGDARDRARGTGRGKEGVEPVRLPRGQGIGRGEHRPDRRGLRVAERAMPGRMARGGEVRAPAPGRRGQQERTLGREREEAARCASRASSAAPYEASNTSAAAGGGGA